MMCGIRMTCAIWREQAGMTRLACSFSVVDDDGLFCIQYDGHHAQMIRVVSGVESVRTSYHSIRFVPVFIVKISFGITVFEQINNKAGTLKDFPKGDVIIDDFVRRGGMRGVSVSTCFYKVLIPFVSEIPIRHGNSKIPAVFKIIITVFRCQYSFFICHVLPYVFGKHSGDFTMLRDSLEVGTA